MVKKKYPQRRESEFLSPRESAYGLRSPVVKAHKN